MFCVYCGKEIIKKEDKEMYWRKGLCYNCYNSERAFLYRWKKGSTYLKKHKIRKYKEPKLNQTFWQKIKRFLRRLNKWIMKRS